MFFKIYDLIKNIKDSFFEFDPNYDISYGIFIRNDTYVNAPIIDKIHGYKELQSLALKTLNGKNSIHNYTDTTIDISKYTTSLPIIIVAHANLHPTSHTSQDYLIIVFSILFYMLLTAILLSDAMSSAFASPIKTLKKFVDDISSGNYFVKTLINTKDEIESLGNSLNEMSSELEKKEKMRRFVSEDLYKQTKKDTNDKASKKNVTILSSDIRNFTTISEQNSPEDIVSLLNEYFTEMEEAITEYGGTIEKIVGDAISAAFFQDDKLENSGIRAVKAGLKMREKLIELNQKRTENNLFTIENGIGLSTGEIITGFAGKSSRKREFILIGNVVHEAELIESYTKKGKYTKIFLDKETEKLISSKLNLSETDNENSKEVISIKNE